MPNQTLDQDHNYQINEELEASLLLRVSSGDVDAVKSLLKKGADPNFRDYNSDSPLYLAAKSNNKKMVKALLDGGADPNAKCFDKLPQEVTKDPQIIELLQEEIKNRNPPLCYAAKKKNFTEVKRLLDAGANPEEKDKSGLTALHYAATSGNMEMLKSILAKGANVNGNASAGNITPLLLAAEKGDDDVVRALLAAGANHTYEFFGKSPISVAKEKGYKNIESMLQERIDQEENKINSLCAAIERGHIQSVSNYLQSGIMNINATNSFGYTPLHYSVNSQNIALTKLLLDDYSANPNIEDKWGRKITPLIIAAELGNTSICKELLEHGANPNFKERNLNNACEIAKISGHKSTAGLLALEKYTSPPLSHMSLIKMVKQFGYDFKVEGVCSGFSAMGIQAFLSKNQTGENDFASFKKRLQVLETYPYLHIAEEAIAVKIHNKEELTEKEKAVHNAYVDVRAFLDNMILYQDSDNYTSLFGNKIEQHKEFLKISKFTESDSLAEQGGLVELDYQTTSFTNDELEAYLTTLQTMFSDKSQDIAFRINSIHHAIGLCFDATKKSWTLIDANQPDAKSYSHSEIKELSAAICQHAICSSEKKDQYLLGFRAVTTQRNLSTCEEIFNSFKKTPAYTIPNSITLDKVLFKQQTIKREYDLLELAIGIDCPQTIKNFHQAHIVSFSQSTKTSDSLLSLAIYRNAYKVIDELGRCGIDINQIHRTHGH